MANVLVVGSLVYDSITTPFGKAENTLGGSANYFALAASQFADVRVVGVVGEDYREQDKTLLNNRRVDLSGLQQVSGKTFRWEGMYEGDMNEAQSLKTELNVFADFNPELPENYRDSRFVFLANIAPELQLRVMEQVKNPLFIGMDTMNFWIQSKLNELKKVIAKVPMVLLNETEAQMITGAPNAIEAAPKLAALGPQFVIVKRGEYGFLLYSAGQFFMLPAVPVTHVVDPTGAGDSFAGGVFGHLAKLNRPPTFQDLKEACIQGTVVASFTIQGFGVKTLADITPQLFSERLDLYRRSTTL